MQKNLSVEAIKERQMALRRDRNATQKIDRRTKTREAISIEARNRVGRKKFGDEWIPELTPDEKQIHSEGPWGAGADGWDKIDRRAVAMDHQHRWVDDWIKWFVAANSVGPASINDVIREWDETGACSPVREGPKVQRSPSGDAPKRSTSNVRLKCEEWLIGLMRQNPEKRTMSQTQALIRVREKWPNLSERQFLFAWSNAAAKTGSAWSEPGAPPKSLRSNNPRAK